MRVRSSTFVLVLIGGFLAGMAPRARPGVFEPQVSGHPAGGVLLKVGGEGLSPLELTAERFKQMPRVTVTAKAHDGKESRYDGVAVIEILRKAGLPLGKELRGKAMALYLVVEAADGYRAVFALPEIDPEFNDRVVLLADRRDGEPLSAREGPLQIIVPGEKRHARWVRQVTALGVGKA
jgi:DMSO/TMAO reductase YedYZ molybdopterin-dependent catalytic subunit